MTDERGNPQAEAANQFAESVWSDHIQELYERGATHQAIADELNRRGVPTYAGKRWHRQTVTTLIDRILKRRTESSGGGGRRPTVTRKKAQDLLRRAVTGSELAREELVDLLRRAQAGDSNARYAILGVIGDAADIPPDPPRMDLLGYADFWERLQGAEQACNGREPWDPDSLVRDAARWGYCAQVQALGITAQSFRMSGDFRAAEGCLLLAAELAGSCESCLADLDRRWVILLNDLGMYVLALDKADASVKRYEVLGYPGHDLQGAGLAKALFARGQARWYLGEFTESAREFETCLELLSPDDHGLLFCAPTLALATALKECGPERQREAVKIVNGVRKSGFMRRQHRDSPHLGRLNWLEGSLKYKLRIGQPCRARDLVEDALGIFVARNMPQEAPAVLADLSLMATPRWDAKYPDREMVIGVIKEFGPTVSSLELAPLVERRYAELRKASWVHGWDAHKGLVAAIRGLRQASSGSGVLPCLV